MRRGGKEYLIRKVWGALIESTLQFNKCKPIIYNSGDGEQGKKSRVKHESLGFASDLEK